MSRASSSLQRAGRDHGQVRLHQHVVDGGRQPVRQRGRHRGLGRAAQQRPAVQRSARRARSARAARPRPASPPRPRWPAARRGAGSARPAGRRPRPRSGPRRAAGRPARSARGGGCRGGRTLDFHRQRGQGPAAVVALADQRQQARRHRQPGRREPDPTRRRGSAASCRPCCWSGSWWSDVQEFTGGPRHWRPGWCGPVSVISYDPGRRSRRTSRSVRGSPARSTGSWLRAPGCRPYGGWPGTWGWR